MKPSRSIFALPLAVGMICWLALMGNGLASGESEDGLVGMLYDLKQDSQRNPTAMNAQAYDKIVADFLTKGWDEHVLNRFYRISNTLHTTQIFIPMLGDKIAPKAMGVEGKIKDGYWVAHFKGQVVPPSSGRYRFVGYAHATLFVSVDDKLVLNGSRFNIRDAKKDFPLASAQNPNDPHGAPAGDWMLSLGSWMDLKADQPVDLDVLFGNRVFSELCVFLLVEKEGEKYEIDPVTHFPILPLFQLSPYHGELYQGKLSTRCSVNSMIWKGLQ